MRLVQFVHGRLKLVPLCSFAGPEDIENFILRHKKKDGLIDDLSLDFCGNYVPLTSVEEARLAGRLLALYAGLGTPDKGGGSSVEQKEGEGGVSDVSVGSEDDVFFSSSESEFPHHLDPDFEMNEELGEPEFGKAHMVHHLW